MSLAVGHYFWRGGDIAPSIPWVDDPDPGTDPPDIPTQPGGQANEFQVAVQAFPQGGNARVLWGATAQVAIKDRRVGPNAATITIPASPVNMRILGLEMDEFDDQGRHLYSVDDAVAWEFLVGSTSDGKVRWRFVCRDEVVVDNGVVTANGVGIIGGLTADRVIGAPERKNLLGSAGSFESGTLNGWTVHGSGTAAGVIPGGVDGTYKMWVTGTPDAYHYVERRVRYTDTHERPWGQQRIAGTAYVQLPAAGLDIDDYGLVTVGSQKRGGDIFWPPGGIDGDDPEPGIVTSDMARGVFMQDPVIGVGKIPTPPFDVDIIVRLHPTDETARTYYDGVELIRRENTSTQTSQDLTRHIRVLFNHAQRGRDKSTWLADVEFGTDAGISAIGTWWHPDGQSLDEAIEAICGQGLEVWDRSGPGRRVIASKRRGHKRTDLQINYWDILGGFTWKIDPGAMRTAVRATSSAGSIWGGADEGAIDTSHSHGQIIDVTISGPVGMTPTQLRRWAVSQLGTMSAIQGTSVVLLPWKLGNRLSVGDSVLIAGRNSSAGSKKWWRITQWVPDLDRRFVAIDVGHAPGDI